MPVRRSARLVSKSEILSKQVINPDCDLSNVDKHGCCYTQDTRPKTTSTARKFCDSLANVPLLVKKTIYVDGIGHTQMRGLCFTQYCPSCQTYWENRIS